jgi:hypothetical protein
MTQHPLIQRLKDARISHERIAEAIGRSQPVATRLLNGTRTLKAHEIEPLERLLAQYPATPGDFPGPRCRSRRAPPTTIMSRSTSCRPMPVWAGRLRRTRRGYRAGAGAAHPDPARAPRLGQGLRAGAAARRFDGTRLPHDDQVLVDKRDCVPTQPGPFLLWDGDGFVMKNIERIGRKVRIFSTNPKYTEVQLDPEEETIKIVGRPSLLYARVL